MKLQKNVLSKVNDKNEVPINIKDVVLQSDMETVFFNWQRPLVYHSKEEAA